MRQRPWRKALALTAALMLTFALGANSAAAQLLSLGDGSLPEDTPPPPPAELRTDRLIDIEMPAGSAIRMGIVPSSIQPNAKTGIVRYVVIARGPAALNATYEGIRCATAQYRIYARKVQDDPWREDLDSPWQSIRQTDGATTRYRWDLARNGMCLGTTVRGTASQIERELRSGNESLYR